MSTDSPQPSPEPAQRPTRRAAERFAATNERPWLVPVIGVAAVGALVAGGLLAPSRGLENPYLAERPEGSFAEASFAVGGFL